MKNYLKSLLCKRKNKNIFIFSAISGQTFESPSTEEKRPLFDEFPHSSTTISTAINTDKVNF